MILYCIRHGESAFNAEGRIQGQLDVPLSPLGVKQSLALAEALSQFPVEAVYASPLQRAFETARPLAEALKLPVLCDDRLMEINAGVFQGKTWPEVRDLYPEGARQWAAADPDFRMQDGETRRELMQRGQTAFEAIFATEHKAVAVVSHGGLLTAAFKALLGVPAERNPFSLFNASVSQMDFNGQVKLVTLNQIEHLTRVNAALKMRTGDL